MKGRIFKLVFVLSVLLLIPLSANAAILEQKKCGDNVTWTLDDSGVLTVSGTGTTNYNYYFPRPSEENAKLVKKIVIDSGVQLDNVFIDVFSFENHTEFVVASNNPYYSSENGFLLSKDKKTLLKTPRGMISGVIPETVTQISEYACNLCEKLTNIELPDNLKFIGSNAFSGSGLTEIEIPDSVTDILYGAFSYCSNLANVKLSNGITVISEYLFGKSGVTNIEIPDSVTHIGKSAFQDCKSLKSINLPDSITNIGERAFQYSGLESIKIPDSVKRIDDCAFYGAYLTDAEISGNSCVLVSSAFSNCSKLTNLVIKSGVKVIGDCSFNCCEKLSSVKFENGVESIGSMAFIHCESLANIELPDSLITLGGEVFWYCDKIKTINIPKNLKSLDSDSFFGCFNLESFIVHPDNPYFSSVGGVLFNKDKNSLIKCPPVIKEIFLPENLISVDLAAFNGCSYIERITVSPDNPVYSSENGILYNKDKTELIKCPEGMTGNVIIPDSVNKIISGAFSSCAYIRNIYIPSGVTHLDKEDYESCSLLANFVVDKGNPEFSSQNGLLLNKNGTELVICPPGKTGIVYVPDGVTTITEKAFNGIVRFTGISFPRSVTVFEQNAFYLYQMVDFYFADLTHYLSIELPGIISMKNVYLNNKPCPEDIVIPDTVTEINDYAFYKWNSIKSVTIPASVKKIGRNTFDGCISLEDIHIYTDTVVYNCFDNCSALKNLNFYEGVKYIDKSFYGSYENVRIPRGIKYIGSFQNTKIKNLYIEDLEDYLKISLGNGFCGTGAENIYVNNESYPENLVIPNTIKRIEDGAFSGWKNLKSVTLPDGITYIGGGAFADCTSLQTINIPGSVTYIGGNAFNNCSLLKNINLPDSIEFMDGNPFYGTPLWYDDSNWHNGCFYVGNHLLNGNREVLRGKLIVKENTKTIASHALYHCDKLTSIVLPNGLISIGDSAFPLYGKVSGYNLPSSLKYCNSDAMRYSAYYSQSSNWENGALYFNNRLYSVKDTVSGKFDVKEGTVAIMEGAFYNCNKITTVTVPNSVTDIENQTFFFCTGLETIVLPDNLKRLNAILSSCENLSSINIPRNLEECYINLGGTKVKSISLPDSVKVLDPGIGFYTLIEYEGSPEQWDNISFKGSKPTKLNINFYSKRFPTKSLDKIISEVKSGASSVDEALNDYINSMVKTNTSSEMLAENMLKDSTLTDKISKFETLYIDVNDIKVEVSGNADIDTSSIEITGAALNSNGEKNVTVSFNKPENDVFVSDFLYDNCSAIDINIEGVTSSDNLTIPVKIKMPVPEGVNSERLVILHYHDDRMEHITPLITNENNQLYAEFTLTGFSTFVFCNKNDLTVSVCINNEAPVELSGGTAESIVYAALYDENNNFITAQKMHPDGEIWFWFPEAKVSDYVKIIWIENTKVLEPACLPQIVSITKDF